MAAALAMHVVKVPVSQAPAAAARPAQAFLEPYFHEAKKNELRVLKINRADQACDLLDRPYANIFYNKRTGYFYDSHDLR